MAEVWFRLTVTLWGFICGMTRDYLGCYTLTRRQFNRLVHKWVVLSSTILLAAAFVDARWMLVYVLALFVFAEAVNRWWFPWLDRREMGRNG